METKLRDIAETLIDIADEIEGGNLTEDDWCSNKLLIESQVWQLKEIMSEMSKHYD